MRVALVVVLLAIGGASAGAAPPKLTPTGELEPREVCATYMDFTHAVQGSVPDGLADSITTMTYDAKTRVKAERWWRIDAPVRIVDHSYDAFGRKVKTTWRLIDQKLVLTIEYRYDLRGNLLAKITRYPNGRRWKDSQSFDKRGRLVLSREAGESGTTMSRRFRYADDRIQLELVDRTGNGEIDEQIRYSYDANGRLKSKAMKPASRDYAEQLIEYKYDKHGWLIERRNTHIWPSRPEWNGPREVMTYEYDKAGNLITAERRVTPDTEVGVRWTHDYSCHKGGAPERSVPAATCRSTYPDCGSPSPDEAGGG